jgi:hypothetical protein
MQSQNDGHELAAGGDTAANDEEFMQSSEEYTKYYKKTYHLTKSKLDECKKVLDLLGICYVDSLEEADGHELAAGGDTAANDEEFMQSQNDGHELAAGGDTAGYCDDDGDTWPPHSRSVIITNMPTDGVTFVGDNVMGGSNVMSCTLGGSTSQIWSSPTAINAMSGRHDENADEEHHTNGHTWAEEDCRNAWCVSDDASDEGDTAMPHQQSFCDGDF